MTTICKECKIDYKDNPCITIDENGLCDSCAEDVKRCGWRCTVCNQRCGGIVGHKGEHQCPTCYIEQLEDDSK